MNILFVCLGNICRSPMAEGIMKHLCKLHYLDWHIDSASTNTYHTGDTPHYLAQQTCIDNGISIANQKARRIQTSDITQFDHIFVMAVDVKSEMKHILGNTYNSQKIKMLLNERYPNSDRDVPDPWYGDATDFKIAYDLIYESCVKIIENYK